LNADFDDATLARLTHFLVRENLAFGALLLLLNTLDNVARAWSTLRTVDFGAFDLVTFVTNFHRFFSLAFFVALFLGVHLRARDADLVRASAEIGTSLGLRSFGTIASWDDVALLALVRSAAAGVDVQFVALVANLLARRWGFAR